ncbi:MAG: Ig-like domain-containing protein, partial [Rhodobiaceae bacterium]|nr:Ig-like domain-containing protein [Rhodobiaceae bacterium]
VFFGTSAGDATRYGYDKQGRLQLLSGKETGLVDWSDENAAVLSGDVISLGTLQTAAAAGVQQATPGQGQSAFASISVRDSELASGAGHIIVGLRLSGPVDTAGLKLDGFPPLALATDGGEITALFLVERSGLLALEIPANADGPIDFAVFSAGDLDEDGEIGSLDLGQFDATPVDIDGDGDADNSDRAILLQNYGLLLNNPPSLTVDVEKTYQDLNLSIDLMSMAGDAEGDPIFFRIEGAMHGTAVLSPDGHALLFSPESGYVGQGSVSVRAGDGYSWSEAYDITIDISGAALTGMDFSTRAPQLARNEYRAFSIVGTFADGGTAILDDQYAEVTVLDPNIAAMRSGYLFGAGAGFTTLVASHNGISAATVVNVGALSAEDQRNANIGMDIYPDAVIVSPGVTRQLLLFDALGENVVETRADEVQTYVLDGSIVEVDAQGRVVGLAPGETTITVIYRSTEILIPVRVETPVVGDNVAIGASGGIVENDDGYQVMIGENSLPRDVNVTVTTIGAEDIGLPLLPEDMGWTFGGAFDLDLEDAPSDIPLQIAIPTNLTPGDEVIFYRMQDIPTPDGPKFGYLEAEHGIVDANGVARTTSPPYGGVDRGGRYALFSIARGSMDHLYNTNDWSKEILLNSMYPAAKGMMATGLSTLALSLTGTALLSPTLSMTFGLAAGTISLTIGTMQLARFNLTPPGSITELAVTRFDPNDYHTLGSVVVDKQRLLEGEKVPLVDYDVTPPDPNSKLPIVEAVSVAFDNVEPYVTGPKLVLAGQRLQSEATTPGSVVIFGEISDEEVYSLYLNVANQASLSFGEAVRSADGRGYMVALQKVDGQMVAAVPPGAPSDQVRVIKAEYQAFPTKAVKPSVYAKSNDTAGSFDDIVLFTSENFAIRARAGDTFVAAANYYDPDFNGAGNGQALDRIAVLRDATTSEGATVPEIITSFVVGNLDKDGNPVGNDTVGVRDLVRTADGTRLYASTATNAVIAIDATLYAQIDADPEDQDHINMIMLPPGTRVGDMVLAAGERILFVADRSGARIHAIGIDPNDPVNYNRHLYSLVLPDKGAITSMVPSHDYSQLIITQIAEDGIPQIVICDMPAPGSLKLTVRQTLRGDGEARLYNPTRVKLQLASDGTPRMVVLDRDGAAGSIHVYSLNTEGDWVHLSRTKFWLGGPDVVDYDRDLDPHNISDPVDIVFDTSSDTAYVLAQRRFKVFDSTRNPNEAAYVGRELGSERYTFNPAGSNIAVVVGLLDSEQPVIAGATRGFIESWGTRLSLSNDGQNLFMSGGRTGAMLVYNTAGLKQILAAVDPLLLIDHPIDDFLADGTQLSAYGSLQSGRLETNTDAAPRANVGLFGIIKDQGATAYPPQIGPYNQLENVPITIGGLIGGSVGSVDPINLGDTPTTGTEINGRRETPVDLPDPDDGSPDPLVFKWTVNDPGQLSWMQFTISVKGPGQGLFRSDTTLSEVKALEALGWEEVTDANGNRILSYRFSPNDLELVKANAG